MAVVRITANLATDDIAGLQAFYRDLLGLATVMDLGWIATLAGPAPAPVQLSLAREGGAGTPVPDLSIEVDDLAATYARARALGVPIPYPLTTEDWGVRRFFVTDPSGRTLNILAHE